MPSYRYEFYVNGSLRYTCYNTYDKNTAKSTLKDLNCDYELKKIYLY